MLQKRNVTALSCILAAAAAFACAATIGTATAKEKRNLGLVGIKNEHGTWLQASSNGQLHLARNRGAEQTWFLIAVNRVGHIYAFANYRTGKFLSKQIGKTGCVNAQASSVSPAAEWKLVPGKPNVDAIALRNVADGTLLTAERCSGGDGAANSAAIPAGSSRAWLGWWDLRSVNKPNGDPGKRTIMGEAVNVNSVPIPVITSL